MLPDDASKTPSDNGNLPGPEGEKSQNEGTEPVVRRRVRVKVRKKIRIKKKPSAKKMIRKIAERAFWTIIVVGFIASLIIMIIELDIRDEKFKQQRRKATPVKTR
jgi:hypothetical protein